MHNINNVLFKLVTSGGSVEESLSNILPIFGKHCTRHFGGSRALSLLQKAFTLSDARLALSLINFTLLYVVKLWISL